MQNGICGRIFSLHQHNVEQQSAGEREWRAKNSAEGLLKMCPMWHLMSKDLVDS